MPGNIPEEPEELEIRCTRCDGLEGNCDCILCEVCDKYVDEGCTCLTCANCTERFIQNIGNGCSSCHYCGTCIERGVVDHYNCSSCGSCRDAGDRLCDNCGDYECCASFNCRGEDCYRCDDCCVCENKNSHIKSYNCKDYPQSIPPYDTKQNFLYLGVECETEVQEDKSIETIAETIHKEFEDEILMKEDGSLQNGIELVTGPYSLEAHKGLWPRLCKTALAAGLRSWKHASTGIHVHLSRKFLTPLDIGKILVFINSDHEYTSKQIRRLAGRGANSYCTIEKKQLTDVYKSENRYEAVNLQNNKTIEIRIFKGTLNPNHILADIEFCHALAYYVKEVSTADIEHWGLFWEYIIKQKKLYSHLIEFMTPKQASLNGIDPQLNEEKI